METREAIKTRRSVRVYRKKPVEREKILTILEAGRWAPSGLNNQPWKFKILQDNDEKNQVADQTCYDDIIRNAPVSIAVFLDSKESYHRIKDVQAIGACIQNMLLEAYSQGLGACWICGVLKNKDKINKILKVSKNFEMKTFIALGYSAEKPKVPRKKLKSLIIKEI